MSNDGAVESGLGLLTPEVAQGRRGHLFLVGGAQRVLEYALGQVEIRPGIKRIFKQNLTDRRAFCNKAGIRYCHAVGPDKHAVLSEEFPFDVKVAVGAVFKTQFPDLFVYPVAELRTDAGEDSYWKTDTHWNLRGKRIFVRETLKALSFETDRIEAGFSELAEHIYTDETFIGDLGTKLSPRRVESGMSLKRPGFLHVYSNNVTGSNGTTIIVVNPRAAAGRLLMFADSFAISCLDLLAMFFREILVVRSAFFHYEMVTEFKPSHVVSSNVERYLPHHPTDLEAPVALLIPQLLGKQLAPDTGFYQALNAQLRPGTLIYDRFHDGLAKAASE
jgi:hypothetical protein